MISLLKDAGPVHRTQPVTKRREKNYPPFPRGSLTIIEVLALNRYRFLYFNWSLLKSRTLRATMSIWIWPVPSNMSLILASRIHFSSRSSRE